MGGESGEVVVEVGDRTRYSSAVLGFGFPATSLPGDSARLHASDFFQTHPSSNSSYPHGNIKKKLRRTIEKKKRHRLARYCIHKLSKFNDFISDSHWIGCTSPGL